MRFVLFGLAEKVGVDMRRFADDFDHGVAKYQVLQEKSALLCIDNSLLRPLHMLVELHCSVPWRDLIDSINHLWKRKIEQIVGEFAQALRRQVKACEGLPLPCGELWPFAEGCLDEQGLRKAAQRRQRGAQFVCDDPKELIHPLGGLMEGQFSCARLSAFLE